MGFGDFFLGKDPTKKANQYLEQVPDTIKPYYDPFINAGQGALQSSQNEYNSLSGMRPEIQNVLKQLLSNPGAFLNQIGQGYEESPGLGFKRDQGLNAIGNAAAAGGLGGSLQHQQQAGQLATDLSQQDYDNYISKALGLFGKGLEGEEGLYSEGLEGLARILGLGYNASNELGQSLGSNLQSQANLSYEGQKSRNQGRQGLFGAAAGALGAGGAALAGNPGLFL